MPFLAFCMLRRKLACQLEAGVHAFGGGEDVVGQITLDDGTRIPVGDSYRDKFRKMTIFGKTQ